MKRKKSGTTYVIFSRGAGLLMGAGPLPAELRRELWQFIEVPGHGITWVAEKVLLESQILALWGYFGLEKQPENQHITRPRGIPRNFSAHGSRQAACGCKGDDRNSTWTWYRKQIGPG